MSQRRIKQIVRINPQELKYEEGAAELGSSPAMAPYQKVMVAMMRQQDAATALQELSDLPLEKRYTWRVASALKWGFADFDSACISLDFTTLSEEDRTKLRAAFPQDRPFQFCRMLKAVFGEEQMERMVREAVADAKG